MRWILCSHNVGEESKQAADSRGAKSREGRAEKPTTTFLGSTTRAPPPAGSPFFYSSLPVPEPSPSPVPLLSYSIRVLPVAGEREGVVVVVERTEPPLAARSRRTRPWVLAAPSSPCAGGLPTSNRRCLVRTYRTLRPPQGFSMFFPLSGCVVRFCGWGRRRPAFGAAAFCFCCVFSGVFVVRFRGFRASVRWSWSRRSRWNSLRLAPIHPADLFGRAAAIRILF